MRWPVQPKCSAEEFQRLTEGLRPGVVAKILGVSRPMLVRYRRDGAPQDRTERLRQFLDQRGKEAAAAPP